MITPEIQKLLEAAGADPGLTLELLQQVNSGNFRSTQVEPGDFPPPDGRTILDMRDGVPPLPEEMVRSRFPELFPGEDPEDYGTFQGGRFLCSAEKLCLLGLKLLDRTAYGILNGGSATSYGDEKKNRSYGDQVFAIYQEGLAAQNKDYEGKPKGITPAFIHPDGTPGPSFIELKIRALAIQSLYHLWATGRQGIPALFQMTSGGTDAPIARALESYRSSPFLAPLLSAAGWDSLNFRTGIQGLIGTFTPQDSQGQRSVFTYPGPSGAQALALPGGHGQNFRVLEQVYSAMGKEGRKFAYLGNVDNLGYLSDPSAVALLAFTGADAGFDFSFKTPVDVKGGLLYRDARGRLNCGDLGVAIPARAIKEAEVQGKGPLLFNCATGLFRLEYLNTHLEAIVRELPLRLSEQDKDAGRYAQVEQVTWEVLGLLENPLIFAVDKPKRFLAAKLLIESFMTSGWKLSDPRFRDPGLRDLLTLAEGLHSGLQNLLKGPYGMELRSGRWEPLGVKELEERYRSRGLADLRP